MIPSEGFDRAIEASHRALDDIARGNPDAFFELYSHRDDATLANPYGPPARGWSQIEEAGRRAASNYRDGEAIEFENFAKCLTADLGYILEIERFETRVAGSDEVTPVALRVTSILRLEDGTWKLLHRHADSITTTRPGESVIQTSTVRQTASLWCMSNLAARSGPGSRPQQGAALRRTAAGVGARVLKAQLEQHQQPVGARRNRRTSAIHPSTGLSLSSQESRLAGRSQCDGGDRAGTEHGTIAFVAKHKPAAFRWVDRPSVS